MATEPDPVARGANAASPAQFTVRAWLEIFKRIWTKSGTHNIGFLAAGVAFFGFLSFVPALGLVVMLYSAIADPETIFENMLDIIGLLPAQAAMLINDQLASLIKTTAATNGFAIIPAVAIALYGASGAASGMVSSLNIIYEQEERRGIVHLTALSLAIVVAGIFIAVLGLLAASATAFFGDLLTSYGPVAKGLVRVLAWLIAGALAILTLTLIYRYGPCRALAKWRWLTLGSVAATAIWLASSVLFGWYVAVASYDKTYGSLGTVVALIMWMYISAYAVLLGAFLDAEAERQTGQDSTTGPERPIGQRGALVADTSAALGETAVD